MNFKKYLKLKYLVILMVALIPFYVFAASKFYIHKANGENGTPKARSSNSTYASNHPGRLYYNGVDADITVKYKGKKVGISSTGGTVAKNGGCHPFTSRKLLKTSNGFDTEVYCIINEQWFGSKKDWKICSDSKVTSLTKSPYQKATNAITKGNVVAVAGEVAKIIDSKSWNANKKTLYKTASLTVLFQKSNCNYDADGQIKEIILQAYNNYAATQKNNTDFKKVTMTSSSSTMSRKGTTDTYISGAISISNLVGNTAATYKISGSKTGTGTVYLCTKADGTGCTNVNSTTISDTATSKTFYVRVDNASDNSAVSINLSGTLNYTETSGTFFCHDSADGHSSWQPLFMPVEADKSVTTSKNVTLKIPKKDDDHHEEEHREYEHTVEILKVNTDGEPITSSGAQFVMREASSGTIIPLENTPGSAVYSYTYHGVDNDTFINKKYCIEETRSPAGYIKNPESEDNCYTITNATTTICYEQDDNSTSAKSVDKNYCKSTLTCPHPDEGEEIDGTNFMKCNKTLTNSDIVDYCNPEDGTLNTTSNMCELVGNAPTVQHNDETGEDVTVCEDGYSLVEDNTKCVITKTPSKKCADDSYTYDNGTCSKNEQVASICTGGLGATTAGPNGSEDNYEFCRNPEKYSYWEMKGGNIFVTEVNRKNSVVISKRLATGGDDEVPGAFLKICAKADYDSKDNKKKTDCSAATTIDGTRLEWVSDVSERTFYGLRPGTYYIIETLPPAGFASVQTATEFSIDEEGNVTSKSKVTKTVDNVSTDILVIKNSLNSMSISKTDIATSKELPGAVISICEAKSSSSSSDSTESNVVADDEGSGDDDVTNDLDDDEVGVKDGIDLGIDVETDMYGNCIPTILNDGSAATWVSGDKPHEISGLPVGTYYLVEVTAPNGYSTAEAIKFVMNEDGTLTDENGNSLKDSKIVMKDKPIVEVKTGDILLLILTAFGLVGVGFGSYYYFNHKEEIFKKIKRFNRADS